MKNMNFLICMYTSENVVQSQQNVGQTHVCVSVTFRNSAVFPCVMVVTLALWTPYLVLYFPRRGRRNLPTFLLDLS